MKFKAEELSYIMACLSAELADAENRERIIRGLMAEVSGNVDLRPIDKERLLDWCGLDEDELSPVKKSLKDKLTKEV